MIKEKFDAEPYILKVGNSGILLCPQCGSDSLHIEKTTFYLRQIYGLKIQPKKPDSYHITDGIVEIIHEKAVSDCYNYMIKHWYRCGQGHKGIIEFQHNDGTTHLAHRQFDWKI